MLHMIIKTFYKITPTKSQLIKRENLTIMFLPFVPMITSPLWKTMRAIGLKTHHSTQTIQWILESEDSQLTLPNKLKQLLTK